MKALERREARVSNEDIVPGFDEEEDNALKIRLQRIDERCIVFYLDGRIDFYNYVTTEKKFTMAIERGFARIIVEARGLNYMSSSGIGILVSIMNSLRPRNGNLVFMHLQPTVSQVVDLLGYKKWVTIAENLDEAVRSFSAEVKDWPFVFRCPICDKRLKASRAGRFRCGECKTILAITDEMQVLLD
jgi:anti-sigma B factor antagonist